MDRHRPRNPPVRPLVLLVYTFALFASGFDVVPAQDGPEAYAHTTGLIVSSTSQRGFARICAVTTESVSETRHAKTREAKA